MNADNQWQLAGTAAELYQELLVPTVFKQWGTDLVELADLSLSGIHEAARNLIAEAAKSARARLESVHKRYAEVSSERLIALTASAMDDRREISSVPLLLD